MTLLKSSSPNAADDTYFDRWDTEVDCCAPSITGDSLSTLIETLHLEPTYRENKESPNTESLSSLHFGSLSNASSSGIGTMHLDLKSFADHRSFMISRTDTECSSYGEKLSMDISGADEKQTKKKGRGRRGRGFWDEICSRYPDQDGDTIIHLAVLHRVTNLLDLVRLLGLQGQINSRNRLFQTPLHLAVLASNPAAIQPLLSLGASLSVQDCHGNTPLLTACERNDIEILQAMMEPVPPQNETHDLDLNGNDDFEVERKAEDRRREAEDALSARNFEGLTCLHVAVENFRPDIIRLLLRHGANINAKDGKSGRTALHFAVESCHPSNHGVIPLLLSHPELQINAENFAHQTALQLARGRHRLDLVDVLHEHGADWSESIGDYCSDTVSDEDMFPEDVVYMPYDDVHVAGQPLMYTRQR